MRARSSIYSIFVNHYICKAFKISILDDAKTEMVLFANCANFHENEDEGKVSHKGHKENMLTMKDLKGMKEYNFNHERHEKHENFFNSASRI
jgi:hypothetical protein